jgi:alkaline phosphatase D
MNDNQISFEMNRRAFGSLAGAAMLGMAGRSWAQDAAPALIVPDHARPAIPCGTASGDVTGRSGVVWSRTDRPARMIVEWSTTDSFRDPHLVVGPAALPEDDYTAKVVLEGIPPGQRISYRVTFRDLATPKVASRPAFGSFRTPSDEAAGIRLAWVGIRQARGGALIPHAAG